MIRHQPVSTELIGPNGSRLPDLLQAVDPSTYPGFCASFRYETQTGRSTCIPLPCWANLPALSAFWADWSRFPSCALRITPSRFVRPNSGCIFLPRSQAGFPQAVEYSLW